MALIKCPECGKEISDTAKNCIHCGYALKEESNIPQPTIVNVEAPKKKKSSSKYLIIGITLYLSALIISFFNAIPVDGLSVSNNADNALLVNISKAAAIISLIYSLVLLAVPKLRKVIFVVPYLIVNLASIYYIIHFSTTADSCGVITMVPQLFALFVSYILVFISLFIRDEKQ